MPRSMFSWCGSWVRPGHEELAMGAIASGDVVVVNDEVVRALKIAPDEVMAEVDSEREELARREIIYRNGRPALTCGKTVILIDDGLATGSTMRAAVTAPRRTKTAGADRRRRAGRCRLDLRRVSGDRRRMRLCHRP